MPVYWKIKYLPPIDRERIILNLSILRDSLKNSIPRRTAVDTLLLATWNIRDFDSNKFKHGPRIIESYYYMAEIISAFDLVALQEVNEDMRPFENLMQLLGPSWRYIATDITEGASGNGERMVFLFNTAKVTFKHIAGEIVLPRSSLVQKKEQFARTPYLVRFQSGWFKFNLCTVHLYYGDAAGPGYERRVKEISSIVSFLKKRADEDGQNYILLGDMNVVSATDKTMQVLKNNKFLMPADLTKYEKKIKWESNMNRDKNYDQIAFYVREDELEIGPSENNAGVFDYYDSIFTKDDSEIYYGLTKNNNKWKSTKAERLKYFMKEWRTWQMSDHLPLWIELKIDFTDKYLDKIKNESINTDSSRPDALDV